jgi:predicted TPR repeat methyltransferase
MGMLSDAEDMYRRLLASHPDHAEGCNNLAVLLARQLDDQEAIALYRKALELRPDYVDAQINYGQLLIRSENFDDAIEVFQTALQTNGPSAAILRNYSDGLQKAGRLPEALAACEKALSLAPDDAGCHVSIGNVYQSQDHIADAETHYRRALELEPENAKAINNLGTLFMRNGDTEGALEHFSAAIEQDPDFAEAIFNKGSSLQRLGRFEDAAGQFTKAIALNPYMPRAYRYLSEIYRIFDMRDEQKAVLNEWVLYYPESPAAKHLLAAVEQIQVPRRASDEFICQEFDDFADSFDETLAGLDYKTPELIGEILRRQLSIPETGIIILDAGCGTGLCGPQLRPISSQLIGVDLSEKMIEQAARRELYDELICAELVSFMADTSLQFDLIVSADTLVYFGPLEKVIAVAASALQPEGHFAFSVELLQDEVDEGFLLSSSGRYCHRKDYIVGVLTAAGFEIDTIENSTLRMESQKPVEGLIVLSRLASTES